MHVKRLPYEYIYFLCGMAVPLFFMCSGFILLGRNKGAEITYEYSISKALFRLKQMAFWSAIIAVYMLAYQKLQGEDIGITTALFFIPIIIINSALGIMSGVNYHLWYIMALSILYLILPILARQKIKTLKIMWAALVVMGEIAQIASYIMHYPILSDVLKGLRPITCIQYFILGGLAYYVQNHKKMNGKEKIKFSWELKIVILAIISIGLPIYQKLLGEAVYTNRVVFAEYFYDSIITVFWVYLIFDVLMGLKINNKEILNWIYWFTPLTYGIYLCHPIILDAFSCRMGVSLNPFIAYAIVLVLSILLVSAIKRVKILAWCVR